MSWLLPDSGIGDEFILQKPFNLDLRRFEKEGCWFFARQPREGVGAHPRCTACDHVKLVQRL